jgi:hypothetical protein
MVPRFAKELLEVNRNEKEWYWRRGPLMLAALGLIGVLNLLVGGWDWHHFTFVLGSLSLLRLWFTRRYAVYPDSEQAP